MDSFHSNLISSRRDFVIVAQQFIAGEQITKQLSPIGTAEDRRAFSIVPAGLNTAFVLGPQQFIAGLLSSAPGRT